MTSDSRNEQYIEADSIENGEVFDIEVGKFICGKQDFTSSNIERCKKQCEECKWRGNHK